MSHARTRNFVLFRIAVWDCGAFCVHPLRSGAAFDFFCCFSSFFFFKVIKKYLCKIAVLVSPLSRKQSRPHAFRRSCERRLEAALIPLPPVCQERSVSFTPRPVGPDSTAAVCAFSSGTVVPAACVTTQVSVTLRGTFFDVKRTVKSSDRLISGVCVYMC